MKNNFVTNEMNSQTQKQNKYNRFSRISLIIMLPLSVFMWQCTKDNAKSDNNTITPAVQTASVPMLNTKAALAGQANIDLKSAANFEVLSGAGVTNVGLTNIYGDLGSCPTTTVTGFGPGVVGGTMHLADPIAAQAKLDLTAAFNEAQLRTNDAISLPGNLSGLTLAPGLYINATSVLLSAGSVTLDAQGDPNAVFVFKIGTTLTTISGTQVILSGGAQAKNIYWIIGSSATLGTNSVLYGNILAFQSIALTTGAKLTGRALAQIGAVTLQFNTIIKP